MLKDKFSQQTFSLTLMVIVSILLFPAIQAGLLLVVWLLISLFVAINVWMLFIR